MEPVRGSEVIAHFDERGVFEIVAQHLLGLVTGGEGSLVAANVNSSCSQSSMDTACVTVNAQCDGPYSYNTVCTGVDRFCSTNGGTNAWCANDRCFRFGVGV
jgi:hypothetical protein